jgi:hypothetical protein
VTYKALSVTLDPSTATGGAGSTATSDTHPEIDITGFAAGATVTLSRNGTVIQTFPGASGTELQYTEPSALAATSYLYTASETDAAGNTSPPGSLTVTISTTAPPAPSVTLDPSSYSGPGSGNGTTETKSDLVFDVANAISGATVVLLRNGVVVASVLDTGASPLRITDPGTLVPNASYTYTTRQTLAGIQGPLSGSYTVTVKAPPVPPEVVSEQVLVVTTVTGKGKHKKTTTKFEGYALTFNEALNAVAAEQVANYSLTQSVKVGRKTVNKAVPITVSYVASTDTVDVLFAGKAPAFTKGGTLTLNASGITDLAGDTLVSPTSFTIAAKGKRIVAN